MANWSPLPRLGKFYGLINPGVISRVVASDCVIVYGHSYVTFWLAIATAKLAGKPLILTTDATHLQSVRQLKLENENQEMVAAISL